VTNPKVIVLNHRGVTMDFANIMSGAGACKPYLKENAAGARSPEKIFEHIKFMLARGTVTLPVEGECAVKVLGMLESDNVTFKEIDEMTRLDPALHSGIIKMANSTYFSGSFGSVNDVHKALVRVGISNVKAFLVNISDAVHVSQLLASLCYVMADFFKVCSKTQLFSVGILSRIGEIFMLAIISDYLTGEDPENVQLKGYKQIANQNNYFVGGTLMKKWKFADDFVAPIVFCQSLQENQYMNETKLLHIANYMVEYMQTGNISQGLVKALKVTNIPLSEKQLVKIKDETERHYREFTSVF